MPQQRQVEATPDFIPAGAPDFIPADPTVGTRFEGTAKLGRIVEEAGKDLWNAIPGMVDMVEAGMGNIGAAVRVGQGIVGGHMRAYDDARNAADKGQTTKSMFKSMAAGIPLVGPMASDIYDDAEAGDNERAIGKGASRILQLSAPEVMPRVLPETMSRMSLPEASDLAAKARALGNIGKREITSRVPILNRFEGYTKPTFNDYIDAFRAKADPQRVLFDKIPKLGDSPLFSNTDVMRSNAEGAANAIPVDDVKPESPRVAPSENLDTPRYRSGESVLNQALTSLDNKTLLKVARSRGIDVSAEANLKPGKADTKIISKIMDDFSQDELDEAAQRGNDAKMHQPVPGKDAGRDAGQEAHRYKVLNTFFPDVSIPKAMEARAQKTISMRPPGEAPAEGKMATPAVEERGIKAPQKRTFERSTDQGVKDYFSYRFDQLRAEMKSAKASGDQGAIADVQRRINELDTIQRNPGKMKIILTGEDQPATTTDWSLENMVKQIEHNRRARSAKAGDD